MEKTILPIVWFNFEPMVGGRITLEARKHKLFNEVRLVIGDFELPLQFKKIEATNLVKRTIETYFNSFIKRKNPFIVCCDLRKKIHAEFFTCTCM